MVLWISQISLEICLPGFLQGEHLYLDGSLEILAKM